MTGEGEKQLNMSADDPEQKDVVASQSNTETVEPPCEKNQLVHKDVAKPGVQTPEKELGTKPSYSFLTSKDSFLHFPPPPLIGWGFVRDAQMELISREQNCRCWKNFMQKHPQIHPRMRSVLLNWLIEVCAAYTLHRQTFYLALDYFDRFMLSQSNVEMNVLQLIGVTCLFLASKVEEGTPLKVSELAYTTAGTFSEDEILKMELIILRALSWNLGPETAVSWLKLFFQVASKTSSELLEPQFSQDTYIQMTRLLDLCVLTANSLDFHYHVLAASVCFHFLHQEKVEKASGLSKISIQPCVHWMTPYVEAVRRCNQPTHMNLSRIKEEDRCNIQTHTEYMNMLDDIAQNEGKRQSAPPRPHTHTGEMASGERGAAEGSGLYEPQT